MARGKTKFGIFTIKDIRENPIVQMLVSNPEDSCPNSYTNKLNCHTCRKGVQLISDEDVKKLEKEMKFAYKEKIWACSDRVNAVLQLIRTRKAVKAYGSKVKAKKTEKK